MSDSILKPTRFYSAERVEVFKGQGRILPGYFYRVVASNGQTLSVSESYVTKWNAKRAARKVADGLRVELYDVSKSADGLSKPYRKFP